MFYETENNHSVPKFDFKHQLIAQIYRLLETELCLQFTEIKSAKGDVFCWAFPPGTAIPALPPPGIARPPVLLTLGLGRPGLKPARWHRSGKYFSIHFANHLC